LWESSSGAQLTSFKAADKPVSACAVSPDGQRWLSGSLDGMLAFWDAMTQQRVSFFLGHTRPISAIVFDTDGQTIATASWDRTLTLWRPNRERDNKQLNGHQDIVAGCRFTPDGKTLVSWSHDGSLRLWDTTQGRPIGQLPGHEHKVSAAAVSPDGRLVTSAARDGVLRLWDSEQRQELASAKVTFEVRSLLFLLDGEALVSIEANGRIGVYAVPQLTELGELNVRLPVQCGALAPTGAQIALGCDDGKVRFLAVDGLEDSAFFVTATRTSHRTSTALGRLFGKSKIQDAYSCTCPACRQLIELGDTLPHQPRRCPHCKRPLRMGTVARVVPEK
jgi:WD40 repeat protein